MKKSLLALAVLATLSVSATNAAYAVDFSRPAPMSRKQAILAAVKHKVQTAFAPKVYVMPRREIMPGDLERVAYGG